MKLLPEPIIENITYVIPPPEGSVVISKRVMLSHTSDEIRCFAKRIAYIMEYEEIEGIKLAPVAKLEHEYVWAVKSWMNGQEIITLLYTSEI